MEVNSKHLAMKTVLSQGNASVKDELFRIRTTARYLYHFESFSDMKVCHSQSLQEFCILRTAQGVFCFLLDFVNMLRWKGN